MPRFLFLARWMLLASVMVACTTAHAQFVPWKAAPNTDIARLNGAASKIAFFDSQRGSLAVHAISPSGELGAVLWTNPVTDKIIGFCWWGNGLLISRVRGIKGETVRVVPDGKTADKVVLPVAGKFVMVSPQGDTIAITPRNIVVPPPEQTEQNLPTRNGSESKKNATIEFYRREGDSWKKAVVYSEPSTGDFETYSTFEGERLYLIGFVADGSGLLAVVPDPTSRGSERTLAFITLRGKAISLSSGNAPFIPNTSDDLPLISPLQGGAWPAFGVGVFPVAKIGILDQPQMPSPPRSQLVAWMPDGEKKLYQNVEGRGEDIEARYIVSDASKKQRSLVASGPKLDGAAGWVGPRLIARTRRNQWGSLLVASQQWEAVEPPPERDKPPFREIVEGFLQRDDIAKPDHIRISEDSSLEKGILSFRLVNQSHLDSVQLDDASKRVVGFRGPAPAAPLPDAPIAPEIHP